VRDLLVLVTGCGSPGVYGLIKSLRTNGERRIRIIGLDVDPLIANRYFLDEFLVPPRRDTPEFMPYVMEVAQQKEVDVVYPVPTAELEMFAAAESKFEAKGQRVVVSSQESLAIANNRARLFKHAAEAGLTCAPAYHVVRSWDQLVSAASELGYPNQRVCLKLPVGTGSIGFRILDSKINRLDLLLNALPSSTFTSIDEIASVLQHANPFPQLIVMEYLPGEEYDVDVLASNGRSLCIIPRRNERMCYGLSLLSRIDEHTAISQLSQQIVAMLGLSYVVNLSFKANSEGQPKLIEINPRIPGSIIAATMAGVNMPYLAVKLALGEHVEIPPVRWGTQMVRYWEEICLSPQSDLSGKLSERSGNQAEPKPVLDLHAAGL
jgi:carbamoyl-phosphate synthase large subunit